MKKILWVACLLFLTISVSAQVNLPAYPDSVFSTYYQQRVTHFRTLPQTKGDSVALKTTGGTIILRHWWYPLVQGALDKPQENTTWYAKTRIWSNADQYKTFWIGFNNLSRSYAADTPDPGTWDDRKSTIWVNGTLITPPNWKHAGQKGDLETPLIDEGYEYRPPTGILLKKGWNTILIKLPVAHFKATDWGNPVKWMFTFLQSE